jgi:hypothetical protein
VPRIVVDTGRLDALAAAIRRVVRFLRRLGLAGLAGAAGIAVVLFDGGVSPGDVVLTALAAAPAVVVLLFAQGVHELASLPDRLRRMPAEGQERVAELGRLAGQARSTRLRGMPLLLWRLRGSVGSLRDVAGFALPLRVLTPGFLGLAALAALLCAAVVAIALVALLVHFGV